VSFSPDDDEPSRWSGLLEAAARADSSSRALAAVRRLRRRLPGDERFGDPLSRTGETPASALARGVAVLYPERDSVAGELGFTALQLWQSLSEATGRGRGDLPLALLYTDLVEFSAWALRAGDEAAIALLQEVGVALEGALRAHRGRVAKRLGDGLLATFLSVQDAVDAALDAQAAVGAIEVEGYRPRMRAGVHWGRPRRLGGDYLGADVSLAALVGESARADQVLVSAPALGRLDPAVHGLRIGRRRRLHRRGAPRELQVATVRRRAPGGA
jgi:adenylate cyclase